MDMYIASLLAGCDGRRTLRELIEAVADQMQTNQETIGPACLAAIRKLMQAGFLSSVAGPSKSTS
jgi:hypothetical protein